LRVDNLRKCYSERNVVDALNLELFDSEILGFIGSNGSGKTTSFHMIAGFIRPDDGKIFFIDKSITHLPIYKRAQVGLCYLPQHSSVFKELTVEQNILAVLEFHSYSNVQRKSKVMELMEIMHISHLKNTHASYLSGGERRRLEIARLLSLNPRCILLDEPFTGIDPILINEICNIINDLRSKQNIAIIISDHNMHYLLDIVDRIYLIHQGKLIANGTVKELLMNEYAKKVYFGDKSFANRVY
jgi:lipopolysaccharide export system ATP-binding protein